MSSTGQNLKIQLDKLQDCTSVLEEKAADNHTSNRPLLHECLRYLREGDTLVITKLDRLARPTLHLTQIAHALDEHGVKLKVLDQAIDTSTPTAKILFNMFG